MKYDKSVEWKLLAQHERWKVEYRLGSRMVRLSIDDKVLYLERDAYQLLWGMITLGLDELELMETRADHQKKLAIGADVPFAWPQTRH